MNRNLLFTIALLCFSQATLCAQKKAEKNNSAKDNTVLEPYKELVPGTKDIFLEMMPIPAGEFFMGSPENEPNRKEDEGKPQKVKVDAFWMGKVEITWNQYEPFMSKDMREEALNKDKLVNGKTLVDAVSYPSPPYVDMSFGMGKDGYPAINMTQYAALMYCKWLTMKTEHFYRLPTEAEWEYACRAGSTTAYHFGNDAKQLDEYAWYYENSNGGYKKVGQKKPNAWGLHDMHGNVCEWTLDQYVADAYQTPKERKASDYIPVNTLYPIAVKGGSWDDDPDQLRSAARRGSQPSWKQRDPQIPKSKWWFTDASFCGFRVVRPAIQPSKEEIEKYFRTPPDDL
jgi:formylglycine-generating enzyme required for sulfatase activity